MVSCVGAVRAVLEAEYPARWAADWDVVGPVCGSADIDVTRVLLAIDPTQEVVSEALALGAQMIVTHHPLHLSGIHSVTPGSVLERCIQSGLALDTVHTNGDVARPGTSDALWSAIGLPGSPDVLEPDPAEVLDLIHVYVPSADREALTKTLSAAGAGRIGDYAECAYWVEGTGQFMPLLGSNPAVGTSGSLTAVREARVEVVCAPTQTAGVIAAMLSAHPYETPAYGVTSIRQHHSRGFGRIGDIPAIALGALSSQVVSGLPATEGGVRVAGHPAHEITRVAVAAGSGDDAIESAAAHGAQVLITSDLRHHRSRDALDLGLSLLDVSHWAAEWPWLAHPARAISEATNLEVVVSDIRTDPWTHNCNRFGANE